MAIKKQNRTLLGLVVSILVVLGYVLYKEGKFPLFSEPPAAEDVEPEVRTVDQDQMGDQVGPSFSHILHQMSECLEIRTQKIPDQVPMEAEAMILIFQDALGPVSHRADRWMNWHLRNREGKERRLRLEITENDEGKIGRELHYFSVDRDGQPTPIEMDGDKANSPTDETINQMLKEGEVFYKERAAYALFPEMERIEYIEKNGELAEVEFIKAEKSYRCHNLKAVENCQCVR